MWYIFPASLLLLLALSAIAVPAYMLINPMATTHSGMWWSCCMFSWLMCLFTGGTAAYTCHVDGVFDGVNKLQPPPPPTKVGKPFPWTLWIGIGLVALLAIIVVAVCCCCGSSKSPKRPQQVMAPPDIEE